MNMYFLSFRRLLAPVILIIWGNVGAADVAAFAEVSVGFMTATNVDQCRAQISAAVNPSVQPLNSRDIRLVNWNIRKIIERDALTDLRSLASESDLVLIQEAALRDDLITLMPGTGHWSFAPGFRGMNQLTGVLTLSSSAPLMRCSLTNHEPWLGSPKATSITRYALSDSEKTLIVVNIHAINFTLGTREFSDQLEQISTVLDRHSGPIILSGDFNTWRKKRLAILHKLSDDLQLRSVEFANDVRRQTFGLALDHVYVRGLDQISAVAHDVASSDHNPMTVHFQL